MNWEETIIYARTQEVYKEVIKYSYLEEDIFLNVERFKESEEWKETLDLINEFKKGALKILDIGCGNGIASIAFAQLGHAVLAIDPDMSDTVGLGAVNKMKNFYQLTNLEVKNAFAESLKEETASFDLVYCRQSVHHANHLEKFILNCADYLKKGGIFISVRDHVVFSESDKKWFLKSHPFHSLYGGENAYSPQQYETAMERANLNIKRKLKHFESVINYFPITKKQLEQRKFQEPISLKKKIIGRLGFLGRLKIVYRLYTKFVFDPADLIDENKVPGRMYTYLAVKE